MDKKQKKMFEALKKRIDAGYQKSSFRTDMRVQTPFGLGTIKRMADMDGMHWWVELDSCQDFYEGFEVKDLTPLDKEP